MSVFDLSEWWIVISSDLFLVGKRDGDTLTSLHRLEMPMSPEMLPGGGMRPRISMAIYPWVFDSLAIPKSWSWVSAQSVVVQYRNELANAIENSERLKLAQRAERAGLTIARGH